MGLKIAKEPAYVLSAPWVFARPLLRSIEVFGALHAMWRFAARFDQADPSEARRVLEAIMASCELQVDVTFPPFYLFGEREHYFVNFGAEFTDAQQQGLDCAADAVRASDLPAGAFAGRLHFAADR